MRPLMQGIIWTEKKLEKIHMTQYERMVKGLIYDPGDPDLRACALQYNKDVIYKDERIDGDYVIQRS